MCNWKKNIEIQYLKEKIRDLEEKEIKILEDEKVKLERKRFNTERLKTVITAFTTIGTLTSAFFLWQNFNQSQERLITERFAKAVEQLGHKEQAVRIGGIYSLERIAKDSPKDQWTIMEVLSTYVRENSPIDAKTEDNRSVGIEIQTALTVIGRRNSKKDNVESSAEVKRLNLSKSNLSEADFGDADLSYAHLDDSIFLDANFTDTNLTNAYIADANLTKVEFSRTNLTKAYLVNANLTGANLSTVNNLTNTILTGANLTNAMLNNLYFNGIDLTSANLTGANLYPTKSEIDSTGRITIVTNDSNRYERLNFKVIKSACFWEEAVYTEPTWDEKQEKWIAKDREANQRMIKRIKSNKASNPQESPDCTKWQ